MTITPKEYLLQECENNGIRPVYAEINGRRFPIPAAYLLESPSKEEALDRFKADFFNHFDEVIYKVINEYESRGREPLFVRFENVELPVPYELKDLSREQQKQHIFGHAYANFVKNINLTARANRYSDKTILVRAGKKRLRLLEKFVAANAQAKQKNPGIFDKFRQYKRKVLLGMLIAGTTITGGTALHKLVKERAKDKMELRELSPEQRDKASHERFMRISADILREEGGYGTALIIDQETHYGVTNPTLQSFIEKFPEQARNLSTTNLKKIKKEDALLIMEHAFFKQYKIDQIENESVAAMLLDIAYNHDYETMRKFTKEGLISVMKLRHLDAADRPRNWKDIPDFLNNCSFAEQKAFYDATVQARIDFMNRPGYIKKYNGLKKRAYKFVNGYQAHTQEKTIFWANYLEVKAAARS